MEDVGEAAGDKAAGLLTVGAAGAEHDEGGGTESVVVEDDVGQLFSVHSWQAVVEEGNIEGLVSFEGGMEVFEGFAGVGGAFVRDVPAVELGFEKAAIDGEIVDDEDA